MKSKNFYTAFNSLYYSLKDTLNISQKEEFYRLLFQDVYALSGDGMYDNDSLRKITSGNAPIHKRAANQLHTCEGFETFRSAIEKNILSQIDMPESISTVLAEQIKEADNIPESVKRQILDSNPEHTKYQTSRLIAGILFCLNCSDYISNRKDAKFPGLNFMRLYSEKPLSQYPKYLTDSADASSCGFIGRQDGIQYIYDEIVEGKGKMLLSGVGGLGKTELAKAFLHQIATTEISKTGIEVIAWVPYHAANLCQSLQYALHFRCELDEVWTVVQDMAADYNNRLLFVIDNIDVLERDEYLLKLAALPCRILITSRCKMFPGISKTMNLGPLDLGDCRDLFYHHYRFKEYDNEILNDIIELSARLTIMIVFMAKVAYVEGLTLRKLYNLLIEKGYKLSDEDVSCEHERMQNDEPIIEQMKILFSITSYSPDDIHLLTFISLIPNLEFDFPKSKRWFAVKKNSHLLKLFEIGMLEHITKSKKHIYWMHSVIAAAIREQQKDQLYDLSRPFIDILSEELGSGMSIGKEHEKTYLIPFSWSVADIMENHWSNEDDIYFLLCLFHLCFACSNYKLCETLINKVLEVQTNPENEFSYMDLVYAYSNKADLLLQFARTAEAAEVLNKIEAIFDANHAPEEERNCIAVQYGTLYQFRADYPKSRIYFQKCIDMALNSTAETKNKDLAIACSNMGRMLLDCGEFWDAYQYMMQAIEVNDGDEDDADQIISYCILANICSELVGIGYESYEQDAEAAFQKVIKFREKNLGKHHADTAVVYHDYAAFLLKIGKFDLALSYNEKADVIETELFSEYSITKMRNLNTKAMILEASHKNEEAFKIYEYIIETTDKMGGDYLADLACFILNYAQALRYCGIIDDSIPYFRRCIEIWTSLCDCENRSLAEAYMGYGECLYLKGDIESAIANFKLTMEYVTNDFNMYISLLDTIASLYIMIGNYKEGCSYFLKELDSLVSEKVMEPEIKSGFCENFTNILEGKEDYEKEIRATLIDRIKDRPEVLDYIDHYFENITEK